MNEEFLFKSNSHNIELTVLVLYPTRFDVLKKKQNIKNCLKFKMVPESKMVSKNGCQHIYRSVSFSKNFIAFSFLLLFPSFHRNKYFQKFKVVAANCFQIEIAKKCRKAF
jgi:hypothetical protein